MSKKQYTKDDLLNFIDDTMELYPDHGPVLKLVRYRTELLKGGE